MEEICTGIIVKILLMQLASSIKSVILGARISAKKQFFLWPKKEDEIMSLFHFNFDKEGPGVEKDTPEKRGFFRWWEIFVRDFSALLGVNLLFFLCSLPFFLSCTIFFITTLEGAPWLWTLAANLVFAIPMGPALAATHRLILQMCRNVPFFTWHEFKKSYKENFKQGAIAMVIFAALADIIMLNASMLLLVPENITAFSLAVLFLAVFVWFSMINTVFQQIALIEMKLRAIFKNSAILVVASGWRGVLMTLIGIVVLVLFMLYGVYIVPVLLFGFFSILMMTTDLIYWPRFKQVFIDRDLAPHARRTARKDWKEVAEQEQKKQAEKKERKPTADEEWASAFLAEREELEESRTVVPEETQDSAAQTGEDPE